MTVPSRVLELVERFERDKSYYKSTQYNETQTRQEFINPLFEALGWSGLQATCRAVPQRRRALQLWLVSLLT